jgi:hypothetical protein
VKSIDRWGSPEMLDIEKDRRRKLEFERSIRDSNDLLFKSVSQLRAESSCLDVAISSMDTSTTSSICSSVNSSKKRAKKSDRNKSSILKSIAIIRGEDY